MLLCSGGCRSGKSEFARLRAEERGERRVFVATAYVSDAEMRDRITKHRNARGKGWIALEIASGQWDEPETWVVEATGLGDVILFDCLTLWTSLCLERGLDETGVLALTDRLLAALKGCGKPVVMVTNELGMGLVPENALARQFRDVAGLVNQRAGCAADTLVFMVCGQPLYVKGRP